MRTDIGFTFLVRDPEMSRLRALVEYLRAISDEFVIVVDDRTDPAKTEALATWPGVTVVPFTWCEDFAAARNAGLPYIQSRWTAFFDPDELPNAALLAFMAAAAAVETTPPLGYLFDTHNHFGGTNQFWHDESDWHVRMWLTGHGSFYRRVHELVMLDGQQEAATRDTATLLKAPADAYVIHCKPEALIARDTEHYNAMAALP